MYYIMRKSYYVMHKLLRYAKNVLRYAVIITLCGNYYVMWRHSRAWLKSARRYTIQCSVSNSANTHTHTHTVYVELDGRR